MKNVICLTIIGILLLTPLLTTQAQEPDQEFGSGGTIVISAIGGTTSLESLNPLRPYINSFTWFIHGLMFPSVLGVSPFTQYYARVGDEGVTGSLATDWTISEDGLTYTFTLRRDAIWSDGIPITATDVKFSFDAIVANTAPTDPNFALYNYDPDDNPLGVLEIVVVDDYTYQAHFNEVNCEELPRASTFPIIPAHVFGYDGSPDFDFSIMIGHEFDTHPSVVYGPFQLDYIHYGKEIALKAVPTWADGPVIPAGIIFRDVSSTEDATARFLAGELDYIDYFLRCPTCVTDIRAAPGIKVVSIPGNSWDFVGLNVADPKNPQPGLDADGNLIDQGHHPIFSDVRVRRAMQLAIDVQAIIQEAANGDATQIASSLLPTTWGDPNLAPVSYDPALANQLLDEAGWSLGPDGIRVCQGCQYALDGTPFEFELYTHGDNTRRAVTATMVKDQLREVGIEVDLQWEDFWTLLANEQTYDAYILGWAEGFPDYPDQTWQFGSPDYDLALGNTNGTSYYNPEFVRLSEQAITLPGCDLTERAAIYQQTERLIQPEQPYIWLFIPNDLYAAHDYVIGFDPQPNMPWWNIHTWRVNRP